MADDSKFGARTMKRKNVKGLALSAPAKPATPVPSEPDAMLPNSLANPQSRRDDTLEIGVEFQPQWRTEDLEVLKDLGAGNGGSVSKVRHKEWNLVMARKIIHVEAKKEIRKRIVRELQIMHECNSPYIVSFYGAFMNESGDVTMCMEYADVGSLDSISKNFGPVRVDVLGKIAEAVLGGLTYLYTVHKIMHRDIKPANVLVNSKGQIKLCDFGVSSELENSVAATFVGTGTYMAPERIQGSPYTVKSDVWSVGLTLMELAIGKFPFSIENDEDDEDAAGPQGILDLLQQIVLEPSPKLPKSDAFPRILEDVIDKCLMKDPKQRPTPKDLFDTDPFLQAAKRTPVDLEAWAVSMMERHNRKSHLAPQLSPATKALLRGEETPKTAKSGSSSGQSASTQPTPTSGEIPISAGMSNGPGREHRSRPSDHVGGPMSAGGPNGSSRDQRSRPSDIAGGRQQPSSASYDSRPAYPPQQPSGSTYDSRGAHPSQQPSGSSYDSRPQIQVQHPSSTRPSDHSRDGSRSRPTYPNQAALSSYESRSRADPVNGRMDGTSGIGGVGGVGGRPGYPARTSSSQTTPMAPGYGMQQQQQPMQMPIRQAPPGSRRSPAEGSGSEREREGEYRRVQQGFVR